MPVNTICAAKAERMRPVSLVNASMPTLPRARRTCCER